MQESTKWNLKVELKWSKFTLLKTKTLKCSYVSTVFSSAQLRNTASLHPLLLWFFFFWIIRQFQQEILLMNLEFSNIKFRSFLAQNKFKTEMTCLHEGQNIGSFCFPFNCAFFQVSIFQLYYASQLSAQSRRYYRQRGLHLTIFIFMERVRIFCGKNK